MEFLRAGVFEESILSITEGERQKTNMPQCCACCIPFLLPWKFSISLMVHHIGSVLAEEQLPVFPASF